MRGVFSVAVRGDLQVRVTTCLEVRLLELELVRPVRGFFGFSDSRRRGNILISHPASWVMVCQNIPLSHGIDVQVYLCCGDGTVA